MLSLTSPGENASLKSDATNDVHIVHHRDADRDALLAALAQLDPDAGLAAIVAALGGKATDAGLAAIVAALGGTLAVSADSLPLPAGAATQATLASILAKIITAPATEAKQDTLIGFVDGIETALAGVLAKIIVAPATEAKQDATNTALGLLATSAQLTTLLGQTDAVEGSLASILAKMIAAPATEAKQDSNTAAVALVGTRAYGAPAARVAVGSATAYSAAITATEVLLHASTRCFVGAVAGSGTPTVDNTYIPLEIGEKFHMRLTSGQRVAVIRDTADGFLNVIPVA